MRTAGIRLTFSFTILALLVAVGSALGQTRVSPGFNLFTVNQDVEIGKQSAVDIERQMPMLPESAITRYVADLGARLASQAPGAKYTYHFKVANLSDVNAFALPGGYVYVDRGLLQMVRTEGELAGVMAHEIAHVALRHSTNQASKAYLAQAGIGVLGGLLGGRTQTTTGQIIGAVGGFGLNALFLKYSRGAETQADVVGSQIMARAGYDPMEMVAFFEAMRQKAGSDPSKVAQFLSDHPSPVNREARVRQEVALLGPVHLASPVGSVAVLQRNLGGLSPASTTTQLASAQPATTTAAPAGIPIEEPSKNVRTFRQGQGFFEIQYPTNWNAYARSEGYGVTFAPRRGFMATSDGQQSLICGIVINHYVPFDGMIGSQYLDPSGSLFGKTPLEEATSDLVRGIIATNPHLSLVKGSERSRTVSGAQSFSAVLSGLSPVTRVEERVTVLTRQLPDEHVVYVLLVAQAKDSQMLAASSDRMVRSLQINGRATHP